MAPHQGERDDGAEHGDPRPDEKTSTDHERRCIEDGRQDHRGEVDGKARDGRRNGHRSERPQAAPQQKQDEQTQDCGLLDANPAKGQIDHQPRQGCHPEQHAERSQRRSSGQQDRNHRGCGRNRTRSERSRRSAERGAHAKRAHSDYYGEKHVKLGHAQSPEWPSAATARDIGRNRHASAPVRYSAAIGSRKASPAARASLRASLGLDGAYAAARSPRPSPASCEETAA